MFTRCLRSRAAGVALVVLTLAAASACTSTSTGAGVHTTTQAPGPASTAAAPGPASPAGGPRATAMTDISAGCAGNSSEVEEAFAPPSYVYAEWIGCGGIGFARSTDSGKHFGAAQTVPGSRGFSWDPAITVAADGTVYAAFMHAAGRSSYPVIAVSRDHGASFAQ